MNAFISLLSVLAFTIIIEFLVYFLLLRKGKGLKLLLLSAVLINAFTNPLANLAYAFFPSAFFLIEFCVIIAEVFLIEAMLVTGYKKALLISIIANLASALPFYFFGI
jgi:hypothetical protein